MDDFDRFGAYEIVVVDKLSRHTLFGHVITRK